MNRHQRTSLATLALLAAGAANSATYCSKIGFDPGTPDPNRCVVIGDGATAAPPAPDTLEQANRYADRGDERTLQEARAHADAGDARTLDAATQHTTTQVTTLQKEAFAGIAQAAALVPLAPAADGETTLAIGAASYGGQAALGLTLAHQLGRLTLNAGVGKAGGQRTLVRVGMGWRF